ncbi:conserved protein of unknown function [Pararobbsia alpina]|uniref:hypothetical protein n=1 Tax=Pararobbsia alpina TaxID=621374 RepID=UPI0039A4257B
MVPARISLTAPRFANESTICFSAYGFGWGYCAFEVSPEVACQYLGAANDSHRQLLLAFQLGNQKLLRAAERATPPLSGAPIEITGQDL